MQAYLTILVAVSAILTTAGAAELPLVKLSADDTVISRSCRIEIPPAAVIEDKNNDGVIQIGVSDIVVEFTAGSVLRGSATSTRPDEYKGYGIRLNGQKNVTIRSARVSGYWCGLWATKADQLVLERIDASDNRRAYLKSTPVAEDGADWLFPHNNEEYGWLRQYASAVYIDQSDNVTVRECRMWHGQNALCLDRVTNSKVYDNDFSFNSGWGIAMWRCEGNVISRNAIDFCVRGYSHGVYNRGQDSAGILMFEQNNRNILAENSATHGGDCFFGFAGREAIAETGEHPVEWYKRRGNCDNVLIGNDFSYAPAHGIEMTFSFGNLFLNNRMVENAICGIWGGYSCQTLISGNLFEGNGEMGYGLERGGVNIEHGRGNRIFNNRFVKNKCGVHLWGGPNESFANRGWGKANGIDSADNLIASNDFSGDAVVFHFRGPGDVKIGANTIAGAGREVVAEPAHRVERDEKLSAPAAAAPNYPVYGRTRPVGARPELRGRANIIMTEWGPWDHASPLVRLVKAAGSERVFELHKMGPDAKVTISGDGLKLEREPSGVVYRLSAQKPGIHPFTFMVRFGDFRQEINGTLISATWDATFFKWAKDVDPREKLEDWRKLAQAGGAVKAKLDGLTLKYGMGGPGDLHLAKELDEAKLGGDYFGVIARTRLRLPRGKWQFKTTSDDGVRVTVDGKAVIENWTWHVPTRDEGTVEVAEDREVDVVVEHFEIDGYSTLELEIAQVGRTAG